MRAILHPRESTHCCCHDNVPTTSRPISSPPMEHAGAKPGDKHASIRVLSHQRGKTRGSPLANDLDLFEYPRLVSLSAVPAAPVPALLESSSPLEEGTCPTTFSTSTSVACPALPWGENRWLPLFSAHASLPFPRPKRRPHQPPKARCPACCCR